MVVQDVLHHPTLGRDSTLHPNGQVLRDPHLASDQHTLLDRRAAGNARLRRDQTRFTDDDVVCNVHEVVDLGAGVDHGVAPTAAVDRGIGANFYVVVEDDLQFLWFFNRRWCCVGRGVGSGFSSGFGRGFGRGFGGSGRSGRGGEKTKTVLAYPDTTVKKNTVPNFAIQHRAMGTHTGLFSYGDTGTNVSEWTDVGCGGQPSGGVHESSGMDGEGTGRGGDTVGENTRGQEVEGHGEMLEGGPGCVFDGP